MPQSLTFPGQHARFIAQRLPAWLAHVDPHHLQRLRRLAPDASPVPGNARLRILQARRWHALSELHQHLKPLKGVLEFCAPLLHERLLAEPGIDASLDVKRVELAPLSCTPWPEARLVERSVLSAALQNYPADSDFSRCQVFTSPETLDIDPTHFARLCHALDLGGQYQRHLDQVLAPPMLDTLRRSHIRADQALLREQALLARLRGELSEAGQVMIDTLLAGHPDLRYDGRPARVTCLQLYGAEVFEVLLIGPDRITARQVEPVVVYSPGALAPLKEYPSAEAAHHDLVINLQQPRWLTLLGSYLAQRDRPRVMNALEQRLWRLVAGADGLYERTFDPRARLHFEELPVPAELFVWRFERWLFRLRDDASQVAVPSARVDAQAWQARLAYWEGMGLNLLNVAALVVPGLGQVMLAVAAIDLVDRCFEAAQAWEQGLQREALEQVLAIGANLAVNAGFAAIGVAATSMARSEWLEGLHPVRLPDGSTRLWQAGWAPYAAEVELAGSQPDALGVYRVDEQDWIRVEGRSYPVLRDTTGHWRLRSADPRRFQPPLRHNGEGAWQLPAERPAEWDFARLLRRIGPLADGLSDAQLTMAARIAEVDDTHLRALHCNHEPLPATLKEVLQRLHGRAVEGPQAADVQRLRRMFPGLSGDAAQEVLGHASDVARRELAEGLAGPSLAIAEEARLYQRRLRLQRAILGLYDTRLASADSALLAQGLMEATGDIQPDQLLEHALSDRPLAARALGLVPVRPWFRSPLRLADGRRGYPLGGLGSVLSARNRRLRQLFPQMEREQVRALRERLVREVLDIDLAISALEEEYDQLHQTLEQWCHDARTVPELDRRALVGQRLHDAWRLIGLGVDGSLSLAGLEVGELPALSAHFVHVRSLDLSRMELREIPEPLLRGFRALRALRVDDNQLARIPDALRQMNDLRHLHLGHNYLAVRPDVLEPLRGLPRLRQLSLNGNLLRQFPTEALEVLGTLPALRDLDLGHNLMLLPTEALQALPATLERLNLARNRIVLNESGAQAFSRLTRLVELSLADNPLVRGPEVAAMNRLEHLTLRNCALEQWPSGLTALMSRDPCVLRRVELSHNRISQLPPLDTTPFIATLRQGHRFDWLHLNDNPLLPEAVEQLQRLRITFEGQAQGDARSGGWRQSADPAQANVWNSLFHSDGNRALREILERLRLSRDFQRSPEDIGRRLWRLLEQAAEHSALRERLVELAGEYPATCGDAGADAFSEMETTALVFRESQLAVDQPGRSRQLLRLFARLYRRAETQRLADSIALQRGLRQQALRARLPPPPLNPLDDLNDESLRLYHDDPIEVRLRIRLALAGPLDYPETATGMLYANLAEVSPDVLSNIQQAVQAADTEAAREQWMADNPSWQAYLRERYPEHYRQVADIWSEGLEYLDDCLAGTPGPLNPSVRPVLEASLGETLHAEVAPVLDSQRYLQATEALRRAHEQAVAALTLSLTRHEALAPA